MQNVIQIWIEILETKIDNFNKTVVTLVTFHHETNNTEMSTTTMFEILVLPNFEHDSNESDI
jgi:hypothetical protein